MWVKPPRNARGSIFECAPELPGRGFAKCGRTFRRVFNEFVLYSADKRNQFADARPARRDERIASLGENRARHHETKLTYAASLANSRGPNFRTSLVLQSMVEKKKKKCITRACARDFGRFWKHRRRATSAVSSRFVAPRAFVFSRFSFLFILPGDNESQRGTYNGRKYLRRIALGCAVLLALYRACSRCRILIPGGFWWPSAGPFRGNWGRRLRQSWRP